MTQSRRRGIQAMLLVVPALTAGGPAGSTQTISLYGYRQLFQFLNFDRGSTVAVIQFLMLLVLGLCYIYLLRRRERAL